MTTSAGAGFPREDEANHAELSKLPVTSPLLADLFAFPSELDVKNDLTRTGRSADNTAVERLLAFNCEENSESASDTFKSNQQQGGPQQRGAQPSILMIDLADWGAELEHWPQSKVERPARDMPRRRLRIPLHEVARARAREVWRVVNRRRRAWYSTATYVKEALWQGGHRAGRALIAPVYLIARFFSERISSLRAAPSWAKARSYAAYGALCGFAIILKERGTSKLRGIWSQSVRGIATSLAFSRRLGKLVQPGLTTRRDIRGALAIVVCVVALGVSSVVVSMSKISPARGKVGDTVVAMRSSATVAATSGAAEPTPAREAASVGRPPRPTSSEIPARTMAGPSISSGNVATRALTASSQLPLVRPRTRQVAATNRTNANVPLRLPSVPQQPQPATDYRGSLAVSSSPEGANVFVNGMPAGATPVVLEGVPVGSRVVRIDMDGHERWSGAVRIVANEVTRITAKLRPTSGQ